SPTRSPPPASGGSVAGRNGADRAPERNTRQHGWVENFDAGYGTLLDTSVRIVTWNIWARYGPWERRAPVILETLRGLEPDIVGLQEVWDDGERNHAREIADALGFEGFVFEPNLEHRGPWMGQ